MELSYGKYGISKAVPLFPVPKSGSHSHMGSLKTGMPVISQSHAGLYAAYPASELTGSIQSGKPPQRISAQSQVVMTPHRVATNATRGTQGSSSASHHVGSIRTGVAPQHTGTIRMELPGISPVIPQKVKIPIASEIRQATPHTGYSRSSLNNSIRPQTGFPVVTVHSQTGFIGGPVPTSSVQSQTGYSSGSIQLGATRMQNGLPARTTQTGSSQPEMGFNSGSKRIYAVQSGPSQTGHMTAQSGTVPSKSAKRGNDQPNVTANGYPLDLSRLGTDSISDCTADSPLDLSTKPRKRAADTAIGGSGMDIDNMAKRPRTHLPVHNSVTTPLDLRSGDMSPSRATRIQQPVYVSTQSGLQKIRPVYEHSREPARKSTCITTTTTTSSADTMSKSAGETLSLPPQPPLIKAEPHTSLGYSVTSACTGGRKQVLGIQQPVQLNARNLAPFAYPSRGQSGVYTSPVHSNSSHNHHSGHTQLSNKHMTVQSQSGQRSVRDARNGEHVRASFPGLAEHSGKSVIHFSSDATPSGAQGVVFHSPPVSVVKCENQHSKACGQTQMQQQRQILHQQQQQHLHYQQRHQHQQSPHHHVVDKQTNNLVPQAYSEQVKSRSPFSYHSHFQTPTSAATLASNSLGSSVSSQHSLTASYQHLQMQQQTQKTAQTMYNVLPQHSRIMSSVPSSLSQTTYPTPEKSLASSGVAVTHSTRATSHQATAMTAPCYPDFSHQRQPVSQNRIVAQSFSEAVRPSHSPAVSQNPRQSHYDQNQIPRGVVGSPAVSQPGTTYKLSGFQGQVPIQMPTEKHREKTVVEQHSVQSRHHQNYIHHPSQIQQQPQKTQTQNHISVATSSTVTTTVTTLQARNTVTNVTTFQSMKTPEQTTIKTSKISPVLSTEESKAAKSEEFSQPLHISIPFSTSSTTEQRTCSTSVPKSVPSQISESFSLKKRIMNKVKREEDLRKIMQPPSTAPEPSKQNAEFKAPTVSPASPPSPKMPILSPQQKLPPVSPLHNEPPTLDPSDTPMKRGLLAGSNLTKDRSGYHIGPVMDKIRAAALHKEGEHVSRGQSKMQLAANTGAALANTTGIKTQDDLVCAGAQGSAAFGRPEVVRRNSLPEGPCNYPKNIPVANVAPFVHAGMSKDTQHSTRIEQNMLSPNPNLVIEDDPPSWTDADSNARKNDSGDIVKSADTRPTQDNKTIQSPGRANYRLGSAKKVSPYLKKLARLSNKTPTKKKDIRFLAAPLKFRLLKATTEFPDLGNISTNRGEKGNYENTGTLEEDLRALEHKRKRSSRNGSVKKKDYDKANGQRVKRSILDELASSVGYVSQGKKQKAAPADLLADPALLGREERALRRAIIEFDRMESKEDIRESRVATRRTATRQMSHANKKAQELKKRALAERRYQARARSTHHLRSARLRERRFTDFKPEVLISRTRKRCQRRYNRNAAYEKELNKEESRNRARRQERLRTRCQSDTELSDDEEEEEMDDKKERQAGKKWEGEEYDGEKVLGDDGCWEITNSKRRSLRSNRQKSLMMKLQWRPGEITPPSGRRQLRKRPELAEDGSMDSWASSKSRQRSMQRSRVQGDMDAADIYSEDTSDSDMFQNFQSASQECNKQLPLSDDVEDPDEFPVPPEIRKLAVNKNSGETLLHKATKPGYEDVALYCLRTGSVEVNARDNAGYTPLHECCVRGNLTVARLLIQYGADVNCCSLDGIRPIHDAVENDHIEIVRLLLSCGADPSIATYSGKSPLKITRSPAMKTLLAGYLGDLNGESSQEEDEEEREEKVTTWQFLGSSAFMDGGHDTGFDIFDNIPSDPEDDNDDMFDDDVTAPVATFDLQLQPAGKVERYVILEDIVKAHNSPQSVVLRLCGRDSTVHKLSKDQFLRLAVNQVVKPLYPQSERVRLVKLAVFRNVAKTLKAMSDKNDNSPVKSSSHERESAGREGPARTGQHVGSTTTKTSSSKIPEKTAVNVSSRKSSVGHSREKSATEGPRKSPLGGARKKAPANQEKALVNQTRSKSPASQSQENSNLNRTLGKSSIIQTHRSLSKSQTANSVSGNTRLSSQVDKLSTKSAIRIPGDSSVEHPASTHPLSSASSNRYGNSQDSSHSCVVRQFSSGFDCSSLPVSASRQDDSKASLESDQSSDRGQTHEKSGSKDRDMARDTVFHRNMTENCRGMAEVDSKEDVFKFKVGTVPEECFDMSIMKSFHNSHALKASPAKEEVLS